MTFFIVGAGFWGITLAERISTIIKEHVCIIDKRNHIGGNCFSDFDKDSGIECHRYGSHIFHTSSSEVWKYITKFSEFTNYQHKVFTKYKDKVYSMPINLSTINDFYKKCFRPIEAEKFLQSEISRDYIQNPSNLEEKAISLIGRPLYNAFIKGYTSKQWECNPCDLPASIITRLPFRTSYNANYFNDRWQGVPRDGYNNLFKRMLDNPLITIHLNCDYEKIKSQLPSDCTVIYSGMPDLLFEYKYGELEWRSLRFEWETLPIHDFQGTSVMNYADQEVPYTRIHEFKHYHPERTIPFTTNKTVICREYAKTYKRGYEAYYPINNEKNNNIYKKYASEANKISNLIIGGRLGSYRYWDMDKAIENALNIFQTKLLPSKIII